MNSKKKQLSDYNIFKPNYRSLIIKKWVLFIHAVKGQN